MSDPVVHFEMPYEDRGFPQRLVPQKMAVDARRPIDGSDNLVGRGVLDHVPETRESNELTLAYLIVQASGLPADIDNFVVRASDDHHRHLQFAVVLLKLDGSRRHQSRVLG